MGWVREYAIDAATIHKIRSYWKTVIKTCGWRESHPNYDYLVLVSMILAEAMVDISSPNFFKSTFEWVYKPKGGNWCKFYCEILNLPHSLYSKMLGRFVDVLVESCGVNPRLRDVYKAYSSGDLSRGRVLAKELSQPAVFFVQPKKASKRWTIEQQQLAA